MRVGHISNNSPEDSNHPPSPIVGTGARDPASASTQTIVSPPPAMQLTMPAPPNTIAKNHATRVRTYGMYAVHVSTPGTGPSVTPWKDLSDPSSKSSLSRSGPAFGEGIAMTRHSI